MKKSNKRAFTLAETIMTLFIVGLVITAAMPVFTQKKTTRTAGDNPIWGTCPNNMGLCTTKSIAIGGTPYDKYDLTVYNGNPNDIFGAINQAENNNTTNDDYFKLGNYIFQKDSTNHNMFITNAPEPINTSKLFTNLIIGDTQINIDGELRNNVIVGNNALSEDLYNSVIIGNNNVIPDGINNILIFGKGIDLNENKNYSIFIGEDIGGGFNDDDNHSTYIIGQGEATYSGLLPNSIAIGNHIYGNKTALALNAAKVRIKGTFSGIMLISSDKRLKNIKSFYNKGLNEILQINPVIFTYKKDPNQNLNIGVVAQELQKIFPEAVVTMPSGYLGVDTAPMFFAMINAMQEVNEAKQIELKRQEELEKELATLSSELKELTSCKANNLSGKIECYIKDVQRFFKSLGFFAKVEVKNAKA